MILAESKTVPIAAADWTDDGEVELLTFPDADGRTHMTPETARALARQLNQAAADAEKAATETDAQRADRATQHGFDVDQRPRRLRSCVEAWPEAASGGYDPRCCRFPKSCSATVYDESRVREDDLEARS